MTESPYRVLVIEDDDDVALFTRTVLQKRAGCEVRSLSSADGAIRALSEFAPDVVITDVELPGASGLDILEQVRRADGDLPVVVMTAHASVDYAVRALRDRAAEFLTKPIPSAVLVETVRRLATAYRESQARRRGRTVLAIGAHPDDVEIGVGGTLAAHAAAGDPVVILTLCRGARGGQADDRQNESLAAAELIGARPFLEDLEDTRIPISDPTVGIIELCRDDRIDVVVSTVDVELPPIAERRDELGAALAARSGCAPDLARQVEAGAGVRSARARAAHRAARRRGRRPRLAVPRDRQAAQWCRFARGRARRDARTARRCRTGREPHHPGEPPRRRVLGGCRRRARRPCRRGRPSSPGACRLRGRCGRSHRSSRRAGGDRSRVRPSGRNRRRRQRPAAVQRRRRARPARDQSPAAP